jgi:hypothetical protein
MATVATYAPRVPVHPDRMGNRKTQGPNLWAILHTSEGGEGLDSAEILAGFLARPGDRPNGSGDVYGSSYHVLFDTDQVIPAVPYDVVAYSAGGANAQGVHGCFPGKARQSRDEWLDPISRAMIRQCAAWLLDIEAEFGIPVDRYIFPSEMLSGDKGLGDHFTVTLAFGKTDHTDVGAHFPWDVLLADIAALRPLPPITDPQPTEGASVFHALIRLDGTLAVYAQFTGGYKVWVKDQATLDVFRFLSGKEVQVIPKSAVAVFRAAGPIFGPVPTDSKGVLLALDAWGVPK